MKVGLSTWPTELTIGDVVQISYIWWYFDDKFESNHKGIMENHHKFGRYLFHHTLKGFELIDDNYNR